MWNPLRDSKTVRHHLGLDLDPDGNDEPKRWENQGRTRRLWRRLTLYPALTFGVLLLVGSLVLYIGQFVPVTHRNPWLPGLATIFVALVIANIKGRKAAVRELGTIHLHVDYFGDSVAARFGRRVQTKDGEPAFETLKHFGAGGLVTHYETFRDRFSRKAVTKHAHKFERAGEDGSGRVRDGLPKTLTVDTTEFEHDLELLAGVSVTHAGNRTADLGSQARDTTTTMPPVVDTRRSHKISKQFKLETEARKEAEDLLEQHKQYAEELKEYVDPAGEQWLEALIETNERLMNRQQQRARTADRERSNGQRTRREQTKYRTGGDRE